MLAHLDLRDQQELAARLVRKAILASLGASDPQVLRERWEQLVLLGQKEIQARRDRQAFKVQRAMRAQQALKASKGRKATRARKVPKG